MDVDGPLVAVPVVAPGTVEELPPAQREPLVLGQVEEEGELPGGQRHRLSRDPHLPTADVDLELTEPDHRRCRRTAVRRASEDRPHPSHELRGENGFTT